MDKKLKQELRGITKGYRPRPLMYIGRHNGKKCYVRKRDLTYWKLLEKYPPKSFTREFPRACHIFAKQHHLTPHRLRRKIGSYMVWGGLIAFFIFTAIIYIAAFIGYLL